MIPAIGETIAIVTPTRDRRGLIERLHESLLAQTDTAFTWLVIDDDSSDDTFEWLSQQARCAPFPITLIRNPRNLGKGASINRAIDSFDAYFYLVVDSDDRLLPDAIRKVRKRIESGRLAPDIAAVFFRYLGSDGQPLGSPPGGVDIAMHRSCYDDKHGKYDGCVGYFGAIVRHYRYPEFVGETYIGPTVIQLLMEPDYRILFVCDVVGIAEYQPNGLTAAGRSLRIDNPRGMMVYSQLISSRSSSPITRMKYRISYRAYEYVLARRSLTGVPGRRHEQILERLLGRQLAKSWLKGQDQV